MATLIENAAAVKSAAQAIDAAIVAKGGTTDGGLNNAAAAIAAIPSGGGLNYPQPWVDDDWTHIWWRMLDEPIKYAFFQAQFIAPSGFSIDWGDGTVQNIAASTSFTNRTLTHFYEDAGDYKVDIYGYQSIKITSATAFGWDDTVNESVSNQSVMQFQMGTNGGTDLPNFNGNITNIVAFRIGDGVSAANGLFVHNSSLRQIILPSSITSMTGRIARYCPNLVSIEGTGNSKTLGELIGCTSLKDIDVGGCESSPVLTNCTSLEELNFSSKLVGIATSSFSGCSSLRSIGDVSNVVSVGDMAFSGCISMAGDITFNSVETCGNNCFSSTSFESVSLPVCTTIGREIFANCNAISTVHTPACQSIGTNMFINDIQPITMIFAPQTSEQVASISGFSNLPSRQTFVIRCADGDFYRSGNTLVPLN